MKAALTPKSWTKKSNLWGSVHTVIRGGNIFERILHSQIDNCECDGYNIYISRR